jgi:hypothetical protein
LPRHTAAVQPPRHVRHRVRWRSVASRALVAALIGTSAARAPAQNPDLILTKAQRDSILATYNNIFPIWGRKAIERGFDLPYPVGMNFNAIYLSQEINITNIGLSTGDNPTVETPFIQFSKVEAPVFSTNLRADLWVLPFLNVYGFAGHAWVTTDVTLSEPLVFNTVVKQEGPYVGLGTTATVGIKHNWLAIDFNYAWTQPEKLNQPVEGRIIGFRYGRVQKLSGGQRLAFWIGTMQQKLKSFTDGSIALDEVIDAGGEGQLRQSLPGYMQSQSYQQLSPEQKSTINALANALLPGGDLSDVTINYTLDKEVTDPWNVLVGANYDLSKRWTFRVEVGFLGRFQLLINPLYRFNW